MGIFGKIKSQVTLKDNPYGNYGGLFSGGIPTKAGADISEFSAMQLSVVWCCIKIISEDSASLPLILYKKRKSGGKDRATDHPLYYLMHDQPNPEMTAFSFREAYAAHLLSWGNAYAEMVKTRNTVTSLWPITPNRVMPYRNSDKQIYYNISVPDGGMVDLPKSQILHTPGLGFNGLIGYSPIRMHREAIGLGKALEEFGELYFGQGTHPGVVVSHPNSLSAQSKSNLEASLSEEHSGLGKTHRLMLLDEGMKIEKIGIPNDEAQFLEARKFQNVDIGTRIYRLHPHMYGEFDKAVGFNSAEQFAIDYATKTLRAWLVRLEQSYNMSLLSPQERGTYYFEHLVDGLLRGDIKSRYEAYSIAKASRILTTNEIREIENRNPIEGGDKLDETPNMIPAGKKDNGGKA